MLRAIGMTRRQLRRTIRFESAITAVIGSLLGLVIGVVFGWIVTEGLSSQGLVFAIPWGTLVACLVWSPRSSVCWPAPGPPGAPRACACWMLSATSDRRFSGIVFLEKHRKVCH